MSFLILRSRDNFRFLFALSWSQVEWVRISICFFVVSFFGTTDTKWHTHAHTRIRTACGEKVLNDSRREILIYIQLIPLTPRFYGPFSEQFEWCVNCQLTPFASVLQNRLLLPLLLLLLLHESTVSPAHQLLTKNQGNAGMKTIFFDWNLSIFPQLPKKENQFARRMSSDLCFRFISQAQGSTALYL